MTIHFYCDIIFFMNRKILIICGLLFIGCFCFGQSADFVSKMIESPCVTYEDAAYFCAINLGLIQETDSANEALVALDREKVFSMPENPTANITYDAFANMCLKTWKIKGGLLYTITKSNRYAFKEMQYLGFIPNSEDPKSEVSGIQMLNMFTRCIEMAEKGSTNEK